MEWVVIEVARIWDVLNESSTNLRLRLQGAQSSYEMPGYRGTERRVPLILQNFLAVGLSKEIGVCEELSQQLERKGRLRRNRYSGEAERHTVFGV